MFFSGGLAAVKIDGKWGYINKSGKLIIKTQFDFANDFSDSLALVTISGKYGFINKHGTIVINPQFDYGGQIKEVAFFEELANIENRKSKYEGFNEGLALVAIKNGGLLKFGYIDMLGKFIITPQYDDAGNFSEGLAAVEINERNGYIDKTGKFVIPPAFIIAGNFYGDLAQVQLYEPINKPKQYTAKATDKIVPLTDQELYVLGIQRPKVIKYGYIDKAGKYIWEPTK